MRKRLKTWAIALAATLLFGQIKGGEKNAQPTTSNMYFNSSFELGDAGFGCTRSLRPDTNPNLIYEKPQIDTTTFVSGKQSMLIPNRFVEETMFYAGDLEWELGQEYTFSIWMKSSVDNYPVHIWLCTKVWRGVSSHFKVGKEWKRYNFTFTAPDNRHGKFFHTSIWFGEKRYKDLQPADLWLDDMQLTPGKDLNKHAPGKPVEISVKAQKLNYLKNGHVNVNIDCAAINNSDTQKTGTVTLSIIDDYTKKQVAAPKIKVDLPPHKKTTFNCQLPMKRYGSYRIKPKMDNGTDSAGNTGYFGVIGKYESRPINLDEDFCVGINFSGGATADARLRYGQQTIGGDVREEYIKMLAEMGCRIIRDHDTCKCAYKWREIEPEEGEFDFTWSDQMTEQCLKYGIQPLPVLQGAYRLFDSKKKPYRYHFQWLEEKGTLVPMYLACHHGAAKTSKNFTKLAMGPEDLWRRYVRAVAERYKGRITHYEIFNEPNLYISPENYMVFVKSASEEIRAADPNAKIVGFCSTGDLAGAGKSAEYLEPCFKQGGLKDADIVSFHPYDSRQLSSKNPSDKMIATYRKLIEKYNGSNPLWNTELYYLSDKQDQKHPHAYDAAKRFLIDLGEGVKQSVCISGYWPTFKTILLEKSNAHNATRHGIESLPAPVYIIYNALARMFERSKPADKIRWPLDTICYIYKREDGMRAAFWKYGTMKDISVTLPDSDGKVTLYDMFGNALTLGDDPIELGTDPYYLVAKDMQKNEFIAWLKSAKLNAEAEVVAQKHRMLPGLGEAIAVVNLRNCVAEETDGQVRVKRHGGKFGASVDFKIPAFETQKVEIPMPKDERTFNNKKCLIEITARGKTYEQEFYSPSLYEATSEFGPVQTLKKRGRGWHMKPEISGEFQTRYDEKNLYVKINVQDPSPSNEPGKRKPWEQDCIELFFDTQPEMLSESTRDSELYHDKIGRLFVVPHETRGKQLTTMPRKLEKLTPENVTHKTRITEDGYIVELSIPWETLEITPAKGKVLGFEIGIDDASGKESAASQITWNSWGSHYKNRISFGFIMLK